MKSSLLYLPLVVALGAGTLLAQQTPPPAQPPPPLPPVAPPALDAPQPERIVYLPHLPSVEELTNSARAQGLSIVDIQQTASELSVTYRHADNSTRTIAYRLLPTDAAPTSQVTAPAVIAAPAPTEVVRFVEVAPPPPPTRVIYRSYDPFLDDPFFQDPFYFRRGAPVSINLGFGWSSGPRYSGHGRHHHSHRRRW